jgi:hypothetical protein
MVKLNNEITLCAYQSKVWTTKIEQMCPFTNWKQGHKLIVHIDGVRSSGEFVSCAKKDEKWWNKVLTVILLICLNL